MKSHFQFTNQQRNGIFLLITIIIALQCIYAFVDIPDRSEALNNEKLDAFRREIDSIKVAKLEKSKPKIYPFNPNFITDYKGYTLGMTNHEIDRLHAFREKDQWINSSKQFQAVTKISDSLLNEISPYFKFPKWVTQSRSNSNKNYSNNSEPKSFEQKIDLNTATAAQLQKIYGIGEKLSERIINYRNRHEGGFVDIIELTEVYGLTTEVIERVKKEFVVKTPRVIKQYNLNTATRDELVNIKYIDYEVANNIIEERTLRDGFKSVEELTKVEDFPLNKIEIIKLYLQL
ncbi:ComEA family DNA-binding protein [Winogradskyella tangerina]|uniref:ComEA family DNA-binding protein n=1 Tax=Winogradskyella tangerina TaxID=2023240 RepID=UPI000DBEA8FA|nr:helix-hairpin-helix domain-containing protein [Winogradskyella tangerina]